MKKLLLAALILMGISFAASAQVQVIYIEDISDGSTVYSPLYYIDRAAKKVYFYDPEDPDVKENPNDYIPYDIKSCKKEGLKETIVFTQANYPVEYKLVLVINPKLTSKDDLSGQSATLSMSHMDEKTVYKALIEEQLPDEYKQALESNRKFEEQEATRKRGTVGSNNSHPKTPAELLNKGKDGVKNLFNKGKDLIKKK